MRIRHAPPGMAKAFDVGGTTVFNSTDLNDLEHGVGVFFLTAKGKPLHDFGYALDAEMTGALIGSLQRALKAAPETFRREARAARARVVALPVTD